jgi:hypothetical protein
MEETNFHRTPILSVEADENSSVAQYSADDPKSGTSPSSEKMEAPGNFAVNDIERDALDAPKTKSFLQKLKLFRKADLEKKNQLKGMVLRPLIFTTFPVISFAGFMYGSTICLFNLLNGTTSLILSNPPYNFSSSMVGLSYVASLIGVFVG